MINIREIIDRLELDPKLENNTDDNSNYLVAKMVSSSAVIPLIIAISNDEKKGHLLIHLGKELKLEQLKRLPTWNGIDIHQEKIDVYNFKNEYFLIIKQVHNSEKKIFYTFVSNLCEELLNLKSSSLMLSTLEEILERWKYFFSVHSSHILSTESQQGLYGELWFLRELLKTVGSRSVRFWRGSEKEVHDFQNNKLAVEVKTLSSKKHYKVKINNERQLDDFGFESLNLVCLYLNTIHNSGEGLNQIIYDIKSLLVSSPNLLQEFESKLFFAGFIESQSSEYLTGYILRKVEAFEVTNGFPRILGESLPNGVGNITYTVELSTCGEFQRPFHDIFNLDWS
ncbi:PD-(D/E)XK motif protein [Ammoniphilus sp. CFH 90114]|uniref:PD-(D/E)XK motif protein n=1 Tax=Ammoniphilus sp. CFH 90114 TaxID=2493665 RepID=UPI00100F76EA|nr:PD-(D/E)XK motif protein [Ammoniphilus sp. CFH 90114]RXT14888.1 PD-(D/E)XK motif protein [Ammoniphilus sp. CFH 90114]